MGGEANQQVLRDLKNHQPAEGMACHSDSRRVKRAAEESPGTRMNTSYSGEGCSGRKDLSGEGTWGRGVAARPPIVLKQNWK